MIMNRKEDGIDIIFSWKEIFILILKRKISLNNKDLKEATFGILQFTMTLHENFNDYLKKLEESPEYKKFIQITKNGNNKDNR